VQRDEPKDPFWKTKEYDYASTELMSTESMPTTQRDEPKERNTSINHKLTTNICNMSDANYLFKMDAVLFFLEEEPPNQWWRGGKRGEMRIEPYDNGMKWQLVFIPSNAESLTMSYCADIAEEHGGIRAIVHAALAVKRNDKNPRAIIFGLATSRSYCDSQGEAIKTVWCARFKESWAANNFLFVLNRLVELDGSNVREYLQEQNFEEVNNEGTEDDEEDLLYDAEEDAAPEAARAAHEEEEGKNRHLTILRGFDLAAVVASDDEQEDEETALRIARRLAPTDDANYHDDSDEEEVAQSQRLF
jgi:hypothetical protein